MYIKCNMLSAALHYIFLKSNFQSISLHPLELWIYDVDVYEVLTL